MEAAKVTSDNIAVGRLRAASFNNRSGSNLRGQTAAQKNWPGAEGSGPSLIIGTKSIHFPSKSMANCPSERRRVCSWSCSSFIGLPVLQCGGGKKASRCGADRPGAAVRRQADTTKNCTHDFSGCVQKVVDKSSTRLTRPVVRKKLESGANCIEGPPKRLGRVSKAASARHSGGTTNLREESRGTEAQTEIESFQTVRLEAAMTLPEAAERLREVLAEFAEGAGAEESSVPPTAMAVLRYEVPLPPTVNALRWLRSQPATPALLPRVYSSPRVPRGGYGGAGSSQDPQLDASSASGIDGGGIGSVAGVGSALTVTGTGPFGWQEWATVRAYLSASCPFVRAYGGTRFNDGETPSPEWAAFGSHHFVIPQVELREGASGALLACTIIWGGPAPGALSRDAAIGAARKAMAQVSEHISAREPKPSLSVVSKAFYPDHDEWVAAVERTLTSFPDEDPDAERLRTCREGFGDVPLSKVVMARRTTLEMGQTVDPLVILECLQERDPSAYQFLIQLPTGQAFFGSTPERLFVRHGVAVASEAVAGTRPRGVPTNTPMDQKIAYEILLSEKENREFKIVRDSIHDHMQMVCDEVEVEVSKKLIKQATVQHLYGRLNGVLHSDAQEFDMLSKLHPTPAVCGHPQDQARAAISAREPFDRGMYAGPVGWLGGDGCEFAVAIRSALTHAEDRTEAEESGTQPETRPESQARRVGTYSNGKYGHADRRGSSEGSVSGGNGGRSEDVNGGRSEDVNGGRSEDVNGGPNGRQGGESTSGRTEESFGRPEQNGASRSRPRKRLANLRPLELPEAVLESMNGKLGSDESGVASLSSRESSTTNPGENGTLEGRSFEPATVGNVDGSEAARQVGSLAENPEVEFRPGKKISLFAGVGIVRGADPLAEWRELNLKTSQFERILSPLPPLSEAPNVNALWARLIIEECCRLGATYFCIAPGSRSSPLAAAAAANPRARCISCIDERSLAFHAVGYGRARHVPAVVITSSGTAVSNLMPAVVEAHQDCVPLLLVTADRPPELRDTGANQTIDQVKHFGSFVRYQSDLPPPDSAIPARMVLTTVDQAVYRSTGSPAGPVHLNCAFREPLTPLQKPFEGTVLQGLQRWEGSSSPFTSYVQTPSSGQGLGDELSEVLEVLGGAEKGLIVVGGRGVSREDTWAILRLAETLGWPIVADAVSGLRVTRARTTPQNPKPPVVYHFDHVLLGAASEETRTLLAPDVVLQLGTRVTSKRTCTFLEGLPLQGYVLVDSHPFRHDPSHVLSHRVEMKIARFATAVVQKWGGKSGLAPQLARFGSGPPASIEQSASAERSVNWYPEAVLRSNHAVKPDLTAASKSATLPTDGSTLSAYGRMLVELSEAVGREIATCLDEEEDLSEPQVARIVAGSVAAEGALFLGNSMAIRDVDMYAEDFLSGVDHPGTGPPGFGNIPDPGAAIGPASVGPWVAANRGASGIDGVLSTATGFAAGLGRPVTLLVGDVSFLHDTNGLLLVNNRPGQPPVVTVVVNNSGGGIFSLLPNVDTIPGSHFTQYWSTPHDVFLDRLCSGHRVKYTLARTGKELRAALAFAWQRRMSWVIEVQTDIDDNVAHHKALQAAVKRTVERSLAFGHHSRPPLFSLPLQNERQISDVQISKFQIQLSAPPTTKARESSGPQLRNGLLVRVVLKSGAVGMGEIAPLEGLHAERLEEAEEQMSALKDALIGRSLPGTLSLLGGAIATWLKEGAGINAPLLLPSVRCGLETALLTSFANDLHVPLSELLLGRQASHLTRANDPSASKVPRGSSRGPLVCALLATEGSPEEAAAEALDAVTRGFCTLKLKVARRSSPAEDAAAVAAVRKAVGPGITIRADANRRWNLEEATTFGLAVKILDLQYVEEPVDNPCDLGEFYQRTGVAIALDESVDEGLVGRRQTDLPLGTAQGIVALVIKPSRVGGIEATASLARWAAKRGISTVISSAFESSVGLSAYAEIAHALDESQREQEETAASNPVNPETSDLRSDTSNLTPQGEPFSVAIRSAFEMSGVPVDGTPDVRTFLDKLEREEKRERSKKDRLLERVRLKKTGGQRVEHGLGTFEWLANDTVTENGFRLTAAKERDSGLEVDMSAALGLFANPILNPETVAGSEFSERIGFQERLSNQGNVRRQAQSEEGIENPEAMLRMDSGQGAGATSPNTEGARGGATYTEGEFEIAVASSLAEYRFGLVEATDGGRQWEVTDGELSDRPLVLFLHGFLGSKSDWLPVMKHLTPSARCIAVDLPGHGQTSVLSKPQDPEYSDSLESPIKARSAEHREPPPSESGRIDMVETFESTNARSATLGREESIGAYGMESVGDAVVALVEQLRGGGQKVMVVGYSMGGRLALYLAVKHPDLINDVVIISGSPGLQTSAEREARAQQDDRLAEELTEVGAPTFIQMWYEAPMWESLRAHPGFESLKAARMATASEDQLCRALQGLSTGRQPSLWEALDGYTGRVLWVTGREDTKFVAIGREVMERVGDKGAKWTLCEMEGCGHAVHIEKAEDLIEVLHEWIPKGAM